MTFHPTFSNVFRAFFSFFLINSFITRLYGTFDSLDSSLIFSRKEDNFWSSLFCNSVRKRFDAISLFHLCRSGMLSIGISVVLTEKKKTLHTSTKFFHTKRERRIF